MNYDVLIAGGGIAGLTSASYLSKDGYKVLLCEKGEKLGGLVGSFDFNGFTFDGGIRAVENSGIIFPMLRQLGLDIDFIKNNISIGIEDKIVDLASKDSLSDYKNLLKTLFPGNNDDIEKIISEISLVMQYMDILYGIDNPLFLDLRKDREYFLKTVLPWMFKYMTTIGKIGRLNTPVDEYLQKFTRNQSLIDMIAQHFFKKTPAFFALSYFSLYLDYKYPKGGTGRIIDKMEEFILDNKGEIKKETEITHIDPQNRKAGDSKGNEYNYKKLIWAADIKNLYNVLEINSLKDEKIKNKLFAYKNSLSDKKGGDSILTLYLAIEIEKSHFEDKFKGHFFYTPARTGQSGLNIDELKTNTSSHDGEQYTEDKERIIKWLKKYYELTTYEISCPVMRDPALAPEGKTGLIISSLMEYSLVRHISKMGWYDEFKKISLEHITDVLADTVFPEIRGRISGQLVSTPLTLEKLTGNTEGAITGWAFTNDFIPAVSSLPKITSSVLTPVPDILQAGQWVFSPSGLPISVLTGKLASDRVKKHLKKRR